MELDDSSKHALAALFSLALHAKELEAGAVELHHHHRSTPWGQHEHKVIVTTDKDSQADQSRMAAYWDAFFGYDLVLEKGLLERVFTRLGIPESSWPGLKILPEVADRAGYSTLVQQYRGILDPAMQDSPAPRVVTSPPRLEATSATDQKAEDLAPQLDEEDEDLAGDLKRARFRSASRESVQEAASSVAEMHISGVTGKQENTGDLLGLGTEDKDGWLGAEEVILPDETAGGAADDSISASELAARAQGAAGPSGVAFTAVTELLDACVEKLDMPQLEDIVKTDKDKRSATKTAAKVEQRGAVKAVNVRWYDGRAREALQLVAVWLAVPWSKLLLYECLLAQQAQAPESKGDGKKQLSAKDRRMRALKIGGAAVGGGALLAITGGLAAPALAAVAGSVMTTVGGSAAAASAVTGVMGSSVGAAAVIGGFGAGGAKIVGGKMARRVGDVKEFGFREIPDDQNYHSSYSAHIPSADAAESSTEEQRAREQEVLTAGGASGGRPKGPADTQQQGSSWFGGSGAASSSSSWLPWSQSPEVEAVPLLPIPVAAKPRADPKLSRTIAVAGWIAEPDDFVNLWRGLSTVDSERFSLVWETEELIALNNSIMNMLLSQAYSAAGKYLIEKFVIHGLVGAIALPMTVLNVSGVIDSTWAVVMNRAARAGELLAHVLMSGAHGDCPVTLVGNSMGSRLIFYCLLELCRCKCKGIVQHAVMLGTPADVIPERWAMARSVVAGRCVNVYSKQDWVLALSFRARQGTFRPAAGLGPIAVPGIENVDVTDIVHGHGDYVKHMDAVLQRLGFAQPADLQ